MTEMLWTPLAGQPGPRGLHQIVGTSRSLSIWRLEFWKLPGEMMLAPTQQRLSSRARVLPKGKQLTNFPKHLWVYRKLYPSPGHLLCHSFRVA